MVGANLGEPLDLVCQHYDRGPPDAKPKLCTLRYLLLDFTFVVNCPCLCGKTMVIHIVEMTTPSESLQNLVPLQY